MHASIVIPVWNGSTVIKDCLEAVYGNSSEDLLEVICVDNASHDDSAGLIAEAFPQARVLKQPVNLGFAGGVNAGVQAAQGDVFILLNQDCIPQPGWLPALAQALQSYPQYGIFGSTIYNPDDTLNHTGAAIRHPDATGTHLTDWGDGQVKKVEFVTGAATAIRRETWEIVGQFDEGYYPAYYEDGDYCYRARSRGVETAWVPQARVRHLFSSQEWQVDPIKHTTNGFVSRYRFVSKHFDEEQIVHFFESEEAGLKNVRYLDHLIGRSIAARQTLRNLAEILTRRQLELDAEPSISRTRQLQAGFTHILQEAFRAARELTLSAVSGNFPDEIFEGKPSGAESFFGSWQEVSRQFQDFRQREQDLLYRIYFRSPADPDPEPSLHRISRLVFKRLPNLLTGREHLLLAELNALHVARMEQIEQALIRLYLQMDQLNSQMLERLKLLEILMEYDYR